MGYDLHITRAEDWGESEKTPITEEEWEAVVGSDPELRLIPENGPGFATWIDPASGKELGWFDWSEGQISTKNPDRGQLEKMLKIAICLGAQVLGDDGEEYTTAKAISEDPYKEVAALGRRRWWFIFGSAMFFLCLSGGSWLLGRFSLILWIFTGLLLVGCYYQWRVTDFRS